jgi:hypothetical protein
MIEQLAHTSAEELRTGATSNVEAGLADLHLRQARRRRRTGVLAAAAVVFATGLGLGAGVVLTRAHDDRAPTPTHPVTSTDSANLDDPVCSAPLVDCLGDRTYRFALTRPVEWALPPSFGANSGTGATHLLVESYRQTSPTAGVTVLERVRASSPDSAAPAPGVDTGPQALVRWIASRPYVDAGPVTTTTLDGRPAWRVRVTVSHGAPPGDRLCNSADRCHLITYQPDGRTTGLYPDMAAQYIALRLPGGGTTVVWSWIFSANPRHLGTLEEAVHSISWPTD